MPNGGFNAYAQRTTTKKFAHPNPEPRTITVLVKAGQVLREGTWLETDALGHAVAHSGLTKSFTLVLSGTAQAGDNVTATVVSNGVTYTAAVTVKKPMTAAEIVNAFLGITVNTVETAKYSLQNNFIAFPPPFGVGGTPETLVVASEDFDGSQVLAASETSALTVLYSGIEAGTPTGVTTGLGGVTPIAGLLMFDVDTRAGAVAATAYVSGSFWADGGFVKWQSFPTVHHIIDPTTLQPIPCTYYNASCFVDVQYQRFTQGTEFHLVTQLEGEKEL